MISFMRIINQTVSLALGSCVLASYAFAVCPAAQPDLERVMANYMRARYGLPPDSLVTTTSISEPDEGCYRAVRIEISRPPRSITVYLTPDQKYLTPALMDFRSDPSAEVLKRDKMTLAQLLLDKSPVLGDGDAPVTIVEFSDFECPFCGRFANLYNSLPPEQKTRTRLVYKSYPLPMHPWAEQAAEIAACVSRQSGSAFWKLHDFFFSAQHELRRENLNERANQLLAATPGIDSGAVAECVKAGGAKESVERDARLAKSLGVQGTPTIFVNGHRTVGVRTADDLSRVIDLAAAAQMQLPSPPTLSR